MFTSKFIPHSSRIGIEMKDEEDFHPRKNVPTTVNLTTRSAIMSVEKLDRLPAGAVVVKKDGEQFLELGRLCQLPFIERLLPCSVTRSPVHVVLLTLNSDPAFLQSLNLAPSQTNKKSLWVWKNVAMSPKRWKKEARKKIDLLRSWRPSKPLKLLFPSFFTCSCVPCRPS